MRWIWGVWIELKNRHGKRCNVCYEQGVRRSNGDVGMRKGCIGVRQDGVGGWCNEVI